MSRTRGYNEIDLWLFKLNTTDTSNQLTQTWSEFGQHFRASELNDRVHGQQDVMFGRNTQNITTQMYETNAPLEFTVGDNVSEYERPTENQMGTIISIKRKPQTKRGGRMNTSRQYVYVIEVS